MVEISEPDPATDPAPGEAEVRREGGNTDTHWSQTQAPPLKPRLSGGRIQQASGRYPIAFISLGK